MKPTDSNEDYTQPVLVTYDCEETDAQRKQRIALGLPTPVYAFMVSRIETDRSGSAD